MSSKLGRSWHLIKASARVLATEPGLIILPILATLGVFAVAAAIYFGIVEPLGLHGILSDSDATPAENQALKVEHFLVLFLFYLGTAFVTNFFNVALAGATLTRLRGEGGALGAGIACAMGKIWPIFGYSVAVAVLGVISKFLRERGGIGGRVLAGIAGLAFGIATFLVIPVIAAEKVGPVEAIRRSAVLLRSTWGENLIGSAGLGFVFMLLLMALVFVGGGAGAYLLLGDNTQTLGIAVLGLVGITFVAVVVGLSALSGIYKTCLYAYAIGGSVPEGFERTDMEQAFRKKGGAAASPAT